LTLVAMACGDDDTSILDGGKHWLVQFHRLTVASDTPDRLEVEIEVLTGANLVQRAPDGTAVIVSTTVGAFETGAGRAEIRTEGGYALALLELPADRPANGTITARVGEAEATMKILVDRTGAMQLGAP
jgi:hypothetical protein